MRTPLTGVERIYADIILDRLRTQGYRFSRGRIMAKLYGYRNVLEELSGSAEWTLDKLAKELGLRQ